MSTCGPLIYSLTLEDGSMLDSTLFSYFPNNFALQIFTLDNAKEGHYRLKIRGTLE